MITKNEQKHRNNEEKTFTRIRRKKKQRNNVNRDVFDVDDVVIIYLIIDKIVHFNIVLYQN